MKIILNRRTFVKATGSAVIFLSLPSIVSVISCKKSSASIDNEKLLRLLADTIFPSLPDQSPRVEEIGFIHHLHFYLSDPNNDPDLKKLLLERTKKFKIYLEHSKLNFEKLSFNERTTLITKLIDRKPWMKKLVSQLENIIFESCFLDPHYGVNKNKIGWKWVNHSYGKPRPDENADYFSLLKKRKLSEIITN